MLKLAFLNVLFVMTGGFIALAEGRANHEQLGAVSLPWVNHGGNWADLIVISLVCLLAGDPANTLFWKKHRIRKAIIASVFISIIMHVAYYYMQPIPGHIMNPDHDGLARLGVGGIYHAVYTVWAFTIILLLFLFSPGDHRLIACILLSVGFIPLAIWQPGWYNAKMITGTGGIDVAGWIQAVVLLAIIWGAGYWRLGGLIKERY